MKVNVERIKSSYSARKVEIVERKGLGHPDTLCDGIAETVSLDFSKFCIKKFGFVLNHMADKIGLIGGLSDVKFGEGQIKSPIKLLLNARFSKSYNNEAIPFKEIALKSARAYVENIMPLVDFEKDIVILDNTHFSRGPGVVFSGGKMTNPRINWYTPTKKLSNRKARVANDTSAGSGFAPLTDTENLVLSIEGFLNSKKFKAENEFVGTDIKVMAVRFDRKIGVTLAVPFIARHTPNLDFYKKQKKLLTETLLEKVQRELPRYEYKIEINIRDNYDILDLYLTAVGSSIENGDEGLVGRGNRSNGLITPMRNMSIEAPCGKNPVYHVGKLYNVAANIIANRIFDETGCENEVHIVSQMGADLRNPWFLYVKIYGDKSSDNSVISGIFEGVFGNLDKITLDIINGKHRLF